MSHDSENRLPAIHESSGKRNHALAIQGINAGRSNLNPIKQLHNAASNAEIYSYKRGDGGHHDALQDHNAVVSMLSRAKSKDHLH